MSQYLTFGSILYDDVQHTDGSISRGLPGGHSLYALSGLRLWTRSCSLHAVVGEDFKNGFLPWLKANQIPDGKVEYLLEQTPHVHMTFQEAGNYDSVNATEGPPMTYELGYLASRPDDIERALDPDTKAIYHHTYKADRRLFEAMGRLRERYGLGFMWEVMFARYGGAPAEEPGRVRTAATIAGMWSLNEFEASSIYGIPRGQDEDLINEIIKAGGEFCLFRVGKKGAYAVTGNGALFCRSIDIKPTVDPTGCGNSSTGAAMWAWQETHDPAFTLAAANISAGYNASQPGPWPVYTDEDMKNALGMAKDLAGSIRKGEAGEL